jgi:hypothetical protein
LVSTKGPKKTKIRSLEEKKIMSGGSAAGGLPSDEEGVAIRTEPLLELLVWGNCNVEVKVLQNDGASNFNGIGGVPRTVRLPLKYPHTRLPQAGASANTQA